MSILKTYNIKIYDSDGLFIKSINNADLRSIPKFKSQINAGYSEAILDLAVQFDDFGFDDYIKAENRVKIYVIDPNYPNGELIYTGIMSRFRLYSQGANQGVQVTLLGLNTLLSRDIYKDGTSYSVAHSSVDPEVIFADILDNVDSVYPNIISYSPSSIATIGINVSYEFVDQTWQNAIDLTYKRLVGSGYFWRLDPDGLFVLAAAPGSATHSFIFGKHTDAVETNIDYESIINYVALRYNNGDILEDSDSASISTYGKRTVIREDNRISLLSTAEQYIDQVLNDNSNSKVTGRITINSTYNIESIKVGHTCRLRNIKQSAGLSDNMLIVGVQYDGDSVTLELGDVITDLSVEIEKLINPTTA